MLGIPTGEPAGDALFALPGAGLPDGTVPLTEPAPWDGPRRPERLLYPNGTPLAVRNQGEDVDQTWHGTAAGAAPAAGDHAPGRLQVVRWGSGETAAVHPALISPDGIEPYAGLSDRQRERWERFDYFEYWHGSVAYLPAHLLNRGDMVQFEQGRRSRVTYTREVLDVNSIPGSRRLRVTFSNAGGPIVAGHNRDTMLAVVIPAQHPTLSAEPVASTPEGPPPEAAPPRAVQILALARDLGARRTAATRPIDYAEMRRLHPQQKAALTRAKRSGDLGKVVLAVAQAVQQWEQVGAWPDDWASWQCALDDALPFGQSIEIGDLVSAAELAADSGRQDRLASTPAQPGVRPPGAAAPGIDFEAGQ
jgi:hypothetical protein